ncbi:hypothetical protein [Halorussus lipolyticus]|uniref:hypothetical protein n=1 Tax=Halorussus lipolyticus TaxID=3034024 RepID=UPI0023E8D5EF|nr:hypothetical protein [Halorussus sp. DT80]
MKVTRLALPLALVALAVLAGCATVSTDETETTPIPTGSQTFTVEMTGDSSATYVVTARLVADPNEAVAVTYANGTNRTVSVPPGQGAVTFGPESGATRVEPRNETVGGVFFEGTANFSVTDEDVPATGNAVFTVRRKGEEVLTAWGFVRCDGHVADLSLSVTASGVSGVGLGCEL